MNKQIDLSHHMIGGWVRCWGSELGRERLYFGRLLARSDNEVLLGESFWMFWTNRFDISVNNKNLQLRTRLVAPFYELTAVTVEEVKAKRELVITRGIAWEGKQKPKRKRGWFRGRFGS